MLYQFMLFLGSWKTDLNWNNIGPYYSSASYLQEEGEDRSIQPTGVEVGPLRHSSGDDGGGGGGVGELDEGGSGRQKTTSPGIWRCRRQARCWDPPLIQKSPPLQRRGWTRHPDPVPPTGLGRLHLSDGEPVAQGPVRHSPSQHVYHILHHDRYLGLSPSSSSSSSSSSSTQPPESHTCLILERSAARLKDGESCLHREGHEAGAHDPGGVVPLKQNSTHDGGWWEVNPFNTIEIIYFDKLFLSTSQ